MNIYINMFCSTKRRKALIFNDILQQESLFLKGVSLHTPAGKGAIKIPSHNLYF